MATPPSLRERALACLARREYSRAELARKLAPHAAHGDELDALLDELARRGWLSDARFAEVLVHDRQTRFGSVRLAHELRRRGVPESLIQQQLHLLRGTELERARRVWQQKFGCPPSDARERARQMRFLKQRGFPLAVIQRVLEEEA
ncbi:recombination regulator RecX [Thiobacter aerophilum]|uniref:Regulatory protein RecX n=1 Tax=Thiobacter aerophilum TaxID=3121275 RepID=A0ABV0EEU7_9BURK